MMVGPLELLDGLLSTQPWRWDLDLGYRWTTRSPAAEQLAGASLAGVEFALHLRTNDADRDGARGTLYARQWTQRPAELGIFLAANVDVTTADALAGMLLDDQGRGCLDDLVRLLDAAHESVLAAGNAT